MVFAYPTGYTPTWTDVDRIWQSSLNTNAKLMWESLRSSGGERLAQMRIECNGPSAGILANVPKVHFVEVSSLDANVVTSQVENALGSIGGVNAKKYLTYAKGESSEGFAGVAMVDGLHMDLFDQKNGASHVVWNSTNGVAITYESHWGSHTPMHELFHTMGAVNDESGAIFASGAGHCYAAYAVMCYDDNDPPYSTSPKGDLYNVATFCPDYSPAGYAVDCLYLSYFRTRHESYVLPYVEHLNHARNLGGAENRFLTFNPPWDYDGRCGLAASCPPLTTPP